MMLWCYDIVFRTGVGMWRSEVVHAVYCMYARAGLPSLVYGTLSHKWSEYSLTSIPISRTSTTYRSTCDAHSRLHNNLLSFHHSIVHYINGQFPPSKPWQNLLPKQHSMIAHAFRWPFSHIHVYISVRRWTQRLWGNAHLRFVLHGAGLLCYSRMSWNGCLDPGHWVSCAPTLSSLENVFWYF